MVHVRLGRQDLIKDDERADVLKEAGIDAAQRCMEFVSLGRPVVLDGYGLASPGWVEAYIELRQCRMKGRILSADRSDLNTGIWIGYFMNFGAEPLERMDLLARTTWVPEMRHGRR